MKRVLSLGFVCVLFINVSIAGIFDNYNMEEGKLTPDLIQKLEDSFELDANNKAKLNAISKNGPEELATDHEISNKYDHIFNFTLEDPDITDQQHSGRCWLFAGLNILRPDIIEKYGLSSDFELSQTYSFFWDKLEKSNTFLEQVIATRKKNILNRSVQDLIRAPIGDGGWWNYVVEVVEKYGVVPKSIGPETYNSKNTRGMNKMLSRILKKDAALLRKLHKQGKNIKELRQEKEKMLAAVYRVLVYHLGIPVKPDEEFIWRFKNENDEIVEKKFTPKSFYKEATNIDLKNYISILDHPLHDYNQHYQINFCKNITDARDMDFINLKVDKFKSLTARAVLDSTPVWFAAASGFDMSSENGIMAAGLKNYESLLNVDMDYSRKEGVAYGICIPNHAMVFSGLDTTDAGKIRKWRVTNSWGTDNGKAGYYAMTDDWFDKYVFNVILPKRYLSQEALSILEQKAKEIPTWDPMKIQF
ncbi:MAG: hypothetical protein K9M80_07225 [Candidatus Marinimicrobia bacterium]|nr:hypothetical protein [Candidatus Neomarinimicrobiota bacterium]